MGIEYSKVEMLHAEDISYSRPGWNFREELKMVDLLC